MAKTFILMFWFSTVLRGKKFIMVNLSILPLFKEISSLLFIGCKVNNVEILQDTIKDENNLRTLYCHKDGSSVKTIVTGELKDGKRFFQRANKIICKITYFKVVSRMIINSLMKRKP